MCSVENTSAAAAGHPVGTGKCCVIPGPRFTHQFIPSFHLPRPVCSCCARCSGKEGNPVSVLGSEDVTSQRGPCAHLALRRDLDKSCLLRLRIKEASKEEMSMESRF